MHANIIHNDDDDNNNYNNNNTNSITRNNQSFKSPLYHQSTSLIIAYYIEYLHYTL